MIKCAANAGFVAILMGDLRVPSGIEPGLAIDSAVWGPALEHPAPGFGDVFLARRCHAAISFGSGFRAAPDLFRKRILHVGSSPHASFSASRRHMFLPLPLVDLRDGSLMPLAAALSRTPRRDPRDRDFADASMSVLPIAPVLLSAAVAEFIHPEIRPNSWHEFQSRYRRTWDDFIRNNAICDPGPMSVRSTLSSTALEFARDYV